MAAEASKLLKGVDTIGLHLAKTALTRDATVSEAPNVGKSHTDHKNLRLVLRLSFDSYRKLFVLCAIGIGNSSGNARQLSETLRLVLDKFG